jgi:predicted chitinase
MYMGKIYVAKQDNPGYAPSMNPFFWELDPACNVGGGTGGAGGAGGSGGAGGTGGNPNTPGGFEMVMTEALFTQMFPARAAFYTYQGLVDASRAFPMFAGTGDMTVRKQEAAAFLANVAHETGNLVKIEEDNRAVYCQITFNCACEPGKNYYGRGPLQLTWNYNYCLAGLQLGLNLRADPDLVARDAKVAYQTALWFWMTQMGAGTMTPHTAITGGLGFGETIRALNGANECAGKNPGQVQSRVSAYTRFVGLLGVATGPNTGC